MGADLYIRSLYDPEEEQWRGRFEHALAERDALPEGSPDRAEAEKQILEYFERMHGRGYFRDPYNTGSLLWRFGLSWWTDVAALLEPDHCLLPEGAAALLNLLGKREAVFREELAHIDADERRYFEEEYRTLQTFLREAIARDEPIECSI